MNPEASRLWRAPRWTLSVLLACLGMIGPFSIDTFLPAFTGIAQALDATPVQMQQTLSSYLFGFAIMNLFHGSLSDSFGRRPVVLWGMALFTLASLGCALSTTIGHLVFWRTVQGISAGAGIVVSRAIIREHVRAVRRAAGDVADHHLLRRGAGGRADGRRLPVRARRLAFDLLVPGGRGRRALHRQLAPVARDPAPHDEAALSHRAADARILAAHQQLALHAAGPGQRRALQRPVPLRAGGARVPGRAPAHGAAAFLRLLPVLDRRHHGRRLHERAAGRPDQAAPPDPPWLPDHGRHLAHQRRPEPAADAEHLVGLPADLQLRLRLGADGAGGHLDGAGTRRPSGAAWPPRCRPASAAWPTASWPA